MRGCLVFAAVCLAGAALAQLDPYQSVTVTWMPPTDGKLTATSVVPINWDDGLSSGVFMPWGGDSEFSGGSDGTIKNTFYWCNEVSLSRMKLEPAGSSVSYNEYWTLIQTHKVNGANKLVAVQPRKIAQVVVGGKSRYAGGPWSTNSYTTAGLLQNMWSQMKADKAGYSPTKWNVEELGQFFWCHWVTTDSDTWVSLDLPPFRWTMNEAYIQGLINNDGAFDGTSDVVLDGGSASVGGSTSPGGSGGLDAESKNWLQNIQQFASGFWDQLVAFFIPQADDIQTLIDAFNASKLGAWITYFIDTIEDLKLYYQTQQVDYVVSLDYNLYGSISTLYISFLWAKPLIIAVRTLAAGIVTYEAIVHWIKKLSQAMSLRGLVGEWAWSNIGTESDGDDKGLDLSSYYEAHDRLQWNRENSRYAPNEE